MTLSAVFFDLDGTLLDTAPDMSNALNRLMVLQGKNPLKEDQVRHVVSDGAYAMLKLGFGVERDDPEAHDLRQSLLDFYLNDLSSRTTVFPGLEQLIKNMQACEILWGVVTNKPRAYAEPLMECFKFASKPICLICPEDVCQKKPHPESLELACQLACCDNHAAIYIGDHARDIQCGQNAQIKTIAVNYGYIPPGSTTKSWGADHVVDNGHEIWPIIKTYL